ncbi:MAG: hypothetical protein ACRBN8_32050 [Nannocystales bacterium]
MAPARGTWILLLAASVASCVKPAGPTGPVEEQARIAPQVQAPGEATSPDVEEVEEADVSRRARHPEPQGWEVRPTRARPCWVHDTAKQFEMVCDHVVNPDLDLERSWLEAIVDTSGFEVPADSPGYPKDVRPGTELSLITARGVVYRTVKGVSGHESIRSDAHGGGRVGLLYTIRLDGPSVGPAFAAGQVERGAVLSRVQMQRVGPTPLRAMLERRMALAEGTVPNHGTRQMDVRSWTDPLDPSMGKFVAIVDELQQGPDLFDVFGGLGYVVDSNAEVAWIVPPESGLEGVSIEHVVDLDGDHSNELIVRMETEYTETLLLVRRGLHGFELQEIYSFGC